MTASSVSPGLAGWDMAAALDLADPICAPARTAYPGFDVWLAKARAERRPARILRDERGTQAFMIVKPEPSALKICSLAVRADARGQGIATELVRQAWRLAQALGLVRVWATAFPSPALLSAFAAAGLGAEAQLPNGELVLARPLDRLSAVRLFHVRMGQVIGDGFAWRDEALRRFLRHEELREVAEALRSGNLAAIAGELADVLYVVYGDAVACGFALSTPGDPHLRRLPAPPSPALAEALVEDIERAGLAVDAAWARRLDATAAKVLYGHLVAATDAAAAACGLDLAPIMAEIQRANLAKEAVTSGKARKPPGWRAPRLARVLAAEAAERD